MTQKWKLRAILAALILTLVITKPDVEKYGDSFQIALPLIALGCALTNGQAADYLLRYTTQWIIVRGSKNLLGEAKINQRPRGGDQGMPSGHTATAVFGASYLVSSCIKSSVFVKAVVILTAGYVGGSRIAVGAHDFWQVLIGALVGWLSDRAFRKSKTPLAQLRSYLNKRRPS